MFCFLDDLLHNFMLFWYENTIIYGYKFKIATARVFGTKVSVNRELKFMNFELQFTISSVVQWYNTDKHVFFSAICVQLSLFFFSTY